METQKVALSALLPMIEETLQQGKSVKLPITGTSMLPLLKEHRDSVILNRPDLPLQKYDLPFYRRTDGTFVLHRVIAVEPSGYVLCGDNQCSRETGIQDAQIIGVVTAICRKGKTFPVTAKKYRFYVRLWQALWPLRKLRFYAMAFFRKLKGTKNRETN